MLKNSSSQMAFTSSTPTTETGIAIWVFICSLLVVAVISGIIAYWIGKGRALKSIPEVLASASTNMDNYIIIGSLILLIYSIGLSATEKTSPFAVVIINIFSSIIFSWLLTRKTSIKDFKEKEEDLALRSYRHINYIESAANTASCTIMNYISQHTDLSQESKLLLSNANQQIKYIQGGISTCKMDWFDLLSEAEQNKRQHNNPPEEEFGTIETVLINEDINQEDA